MPAKSPQQLKLIYSIRRKYKSENKTPKKWKWVWGEEWGHLAKESHILDFKGFAQLEAISNFTDDVISQEDLEFVEDILIEFSDKWNMSMETHAGYNGYISVKGVLMGGKPVIDIGIQLNPHAGLSESDKKQFVEDIKVVISRFYKLGFSDALPKNKNFRSSEWAGFNTYGVLLKPPARVNEANQNLKSRAHLDECWYRAKIGDIVTEEYIYNYCQYLHDKYDEAFIEGDLGDRIEEFNNYQLKEIPLSEIDLEEFDLDDWAVGDYKSLIKSSNDYPPIVLGDTYQGKWTVIDGTHRANALKELEYKKIKAWVGLN